MALAVSLSASSKESSITVCNIEEHEETRYGSGGVTIGIKQK
jgi:hypothetical protein